MDEQHSIGQMQGRRDKSALLRSFAFTKESLAIEGLALTQEEERFFARMVNEGMNMEQVKCILYPFVSN